MHAARLFPILAAVLLAGLTVGLWCQRDVGLADNGDFTRAIFTFTPGPVGRPAGPIFFNTPEGHWRFYHDWLPRWEKRWFLARPASSVELLWAPGLLATAAGAGAGAVDLRVLGVFPRLLLLGECLLLMLWIARQPTGRFVLLGTLGVPAVLLFTSTDYVAYLQSFYQELASLVFVLPFLFSLVFFRRQPTRGRLLVALACLLLLTTAKSSTFYWPAVALPFGLWAWLGGEPERRAGRRWLVAVAVGIVGTLALTLACKRATLAPGSAANPYHSLFYGALTFSQHPDTHLARLGFPEGHECVGQPFETSAASRFLAAHPHRPGFGDALSTYLHEPRSAFGAAAHALGHMQDLSLDYLGKYAREDPRAARYTPTDWRGREERLWRADLDGEAWNGWSTLKFWCFPTGGALALCLVVFAGWFARGFLRGPDDGTARDLATVGLPATLACAVDMMVAVLGDGRFELIKHLFLANLLFDLAAITFVGSVAFSINEQRISRKIMTKMQI